MMEGKNVKYSIDIVGDGSYFSTVHWNAKLGDKKKE